MSDMERRGVADQSATILASVSQSSDGVGGVRLDQSGHYGNARQPDATLTQQAEQRSMSRSLSCSSTNCTDVCTARIYTHYTNCMYCESWGIAPLSHFV